MKRRLSERVLIFVVLVLLAWPAMAYVQEVHQAMTRKAFDHLQIDFPVHLGVIDKYKVNGVSLRDWMAEGAYDEDVPAPRVRNHFFDPVHAGKALRVPAVFCAELGTPADEWALEPGGIFGNFYSLAALKQRYLNAVLSRNPGSRDVFLKELFLGLGHVVHLVEDMAQPEHTRNDQHLTASQLLLSNGTEASIYEQWAGDNLRDPSTSIVGYDGYPNVKLPDYESYFHTGDMKGDRPAGKGLADYSSLNFVTQDTNYHDEDRFWSCSFVEPRAPKCDYFAEPREAEAVARFQSVQYLVEDMFGRTQSVPVEEFVFTSQVRDRYLGTQDPDLAHTYLSSLDHEIGKLGCKPLYSLGDFSYQTRAGLLVPRAVGYSAGLIEHFFRGKINATWTAVPGSSGVYDLTIENFSDEPIGDAKVTAIYLAPPAYFNRGNSDDTMLIMQGQGIAELDPSFGVLVSGGSVTLHNIPIPGLSASDSLLSFETRVAVTGTLGSENDAVITVVQPPSGMLFKLESSVELVKMFVTCGGSVSGFRNVPADYSSRPPIHEIQVAIAPGEQCRAVLFDVEAARPSFEGQQVGLTLRVTRNGAVVEDESATIDASDLAGGGCHTATRSGHCDRFISRTGSCTGANPPYKCITTIEQWGDYSGPFGISGGDPDR